MKINLNDYTTLEFYKGNELLLFFNTKLFPDMQLILNHKETPCFEYTSSLSFDSDFSLGSEVLNYLRLDEAMQSSRNIESVINHINTILKQYNYTFFYHNEKFSNVMVSDIYKFINNGITEIHIQFIKRDRLNNYKKIIFDVDLEILRFYSYSWDSNLYIDSFDIEDELDRIAEDKLYQECLEQNLGDEQLFEQFYNNIPVPTDKDFYNDKNDIYIATIEDLKILQED